MSRGWKLALGVGAAILALNLLLAAIHSLTGGSPGGPRSSSYATGGDGLAAYADLVARAGHPVERKRAGPAESELRPEETAVVLDAGLVGGNDAAALRRFVLGGGRLIAGGEFAFWANRIVGGGLSWSPDSVTDGRVVAPIPEVAGVKRLAGLAGGSWDQPGGALPAYAGPTGTLLAIARVGSGRVVLLADAAPLQNAPLDEADNAALGLALAGPKQRPVVFLESFHGYGPASGFDAIPREWWLLFATAALAAAVFVVARGRRLGPPEPAARELPPPRLEYVDSLGGVLARTRGRADVAKPLQIEAGRLLQRRLGLEPGEADFVAAATRLGLPPEDAAALVLPATTDADLLAVGRAHASLVQSQGGDGWRS